jgi:hypothetical protein
LTDSFSTEKLLAGFKRPKGGRGRMAFVRWAQRLAAVPDTSSPAIGHGEEGGQGMDLVRRRDEIGGLEFVVGWSWRRILAAMGVVVGLALATVSIWVFVGVGGSGPESRVSTAALLGIVVFLVGLGLVGAWLGVSWISI